MVKAQNKPKPSWSWETKLGKLAIRSLWIVLVKKTHLTIPSSIGQNKMGGGGGKIRPNLRRLRRWVRWRPPTRSRWTSPGTWRARGEARTTAGPSWTGRGTCTRTPESRTPVQTKLSQSLRWVLILPNGKLSGYVPQKPFTTKGKISIEAFRISFRPMAFSKCFGGQWVYSVNYQSSVGYGQGMAVSFNKNYPSGMK